MEKNPINSFELFTFLSQEGISIKIKGFCSLNKLDGIIYESSKLFVDLMKFFIFFMTSMGDELFEICL